MYDGKTQLLIENPINRISHQLANAARGNEKEFRRVMLTLYIQKDSPSAEQESELVARA